MLYPRHVCSSLIIASCLSACGGGGSENGGLPFTPATSIPAHIEGLDGSITLEATNNSDAWVINANGDRTLAIEIPLSIRIADTPNLQTCRFENQQVEINVTDTSEIRISCDAKRLLVIEEKDGPDNTKTSLWITDGESLTKLSNDQDSVDQRTDTFFYLDNAYYLNKGMLWSTDGTPSGTGNVSLPGIVTVSWLGKLAGQPEDQLFFIGQDAQNNPGFYQLHTKPTGYTHLDIAGEYTVDHFTQAQPSGIYEYQLENNTLTIISRYAFQSSSNSTNTPEVFQRDADYVLYDAGLFSIDKNSNAPAVEIPLPEHSAPLLGLFMQSLPDNRILVMFDYQAQGMPYCPVSYLLDSTNNWQLVKNDCTTQSGEEIIHLSWTDDGLLFQKDDDYWIFNSDQQENRQVTDVAQRPEELGQLTVFSDGLLVSSGSNLLDSNSDNATLSLNVWYYSFGSESPNLIAASDTAIYSNTDIPTLPSSALNCFGLDESTSIFDNHFFTLYKEDSGLQLWVTDGTTNGTKKLTHRTLGELAPCGWNYQP